jgi:xylulokinase
MNYILAHDLGTSGNKATLFSLDGKMGASVLYEYPAYYPGALCVEQDPEDWWKAVCVSTRQLLEKAGVAPGDIAVVSFSGQQMGCLIVDKDGSPLRKMIIWADTRAGAQAGEIEKKLGADYVYHTTGHRVSASYSAAKLLWIRDNESANYKRAYKMLLAKDYIVFKLTGKFVTDYSDASGTNLFDINHLTWDKKILDTLDIPAGLLPDTFPSAEKAGRVSTAAASETGLKEGTPVVIGGGDGSCACVGAGVVSEGSAYVVLGSSSWISLASKAPRYDDEKRTFNWVHLDPELYTPCGTMQAAGFSYNWYRNTLCRDEIARSEKEGTKAYALIDEAVKESPAGSGGLLYLPYLLGERSPRWNHEARGAFIGLSITSGKGDISRSVLEGVGFNLRLILEILEKDGGIEELTAIGGGAKGAVWLQILADIWQKPLHIPVFTEEATSLGAAIAGGIGIGAFKNYGVIREFNAVRNTVTPDAAKSASYNELYSIFNEAYAALLGTYGRLAAYNRRFPKL